MSFLLLTVQPLAALWRVIRQLREDKVARQVVSCRVEYAVRAELDVVLTRVELVKNMLDKSSCVVDAA